MCGIVGQRAGEVDELLLAGGERVAALADRLVEAVRQAVNKIEHVDVARGAAHGLVGDLLVAEANVFADGAGEEEWILQDDGEVAAQFGEIVLAQIDAV